MRWQPKSISFPLVSSFKALWDKFSLFGNWRSTQEILEHFGAGQFFPRLGRKHLSLEDLLY